MDFNVNLKQLKTDYDVTLHKINKSILGQIPSLFIDSLNRSIDGTDEISFTVPRYIMGRDGLSKTTHPIYNEIKAERFICINNEEYFVIKEATEDDYKNKKVKAFSGEVKLGKIDIDLEDVGLQLFTSDVESGIISLNTYMKEEIGWTLGHVDDVIAYDISQDGTKTEKVRWQESVNSNWHDFLIKDIKEQFECVVMFDTYNKKINLYHIDSFGDNIQLYLSKDNYVKSVSSISDSQDIVTRMKLVGNEEMDIIGATATGYNYIDDYSYFIENEEMSTELIFALQEYERMVTLREVTWRQLFTRKNEIESILIDKKNELYLVYALIESLKSQKKAYSIEITDENKIEIEEELARINADLTVKNDERVILEVTIDGFEEELVDLKASITNINILCKRETCTNNDGYLIFNETLLDELKEFLYYETYTNDSFLKEEDIISSGKRELSLKCKPTVEWSIDVVNFMTRIMDNGFRKHWNGTLSLGDIIILYNDEDKKEELIYFTGYTLNLKDKTLDITLSNKKTKVDNSKVIGDYLNMAEKSLKTISMKKYLFIQQKYNRINLDYKKV